MVDELVGDASRCITRSKATRSSPMLDGSHGIEDAQFVSGILCDAAAAIDLGGLLPECACATGQAGAVVARLRRRSGRCPGYPAT